MKKAILMMALVIGFAGMSKTIAQGKGFEKNASQRLEKMQEELSLTEDQMDQLKNFHDQFRSEMLALRKNESLSTEEFHELFLQKREAHHNQIRNILSEEQKEKFDAFAWQGRGPNFTGSPSGKRNDRFSGEQISGLAEKRAEFDNELSEEEKDVIAQFRLKCENWQCNRPVGVENDGRCGRKGFGGGNEAMKPILDIVKNHEERITEILDVFRPERPADCPKGNAYGRHGRKFGAGEGPRFRAVHFLLMDTPAMKYGNMNEMVSGVNISPNPARDQINISYDLPVESNVSIELLGKDGNVIDKFEQSRQEIGINEVKYDVSRLTSGELYFVRVLTDNIVWVNKFIKL
jgi:hypothetical protein